MHIHKRGDFEYLDEGQGEVLILLHGLFGALSNWGTVTEFFSKKYRVIIPLLPLYTLPYEKVNLDGLLKYVAAFNEEMGLKHFTIIGNSLGGHVALLYVLNFGEQVKRLILTGSSGLYENTMRGSYPKRGDYNYVTKKVGYTFYDPKTATKDLIDQVYTITTNRSMVKRVIMYARSAQKNNLLNELPSIKQPTFLVWGLNDTITPPSVAHQFHNLIPNSELKFLDKCCHVPMMEHSKYFNSLVDDFLIRHN